MTIKVINANYSGLSDSIVITVEDVSVAKSISISGAATPVTEIKKDQSKTYIATVYDGVNIVGESVTWQLLNDAETGSTTYASIWIV